MQFSLFGVPVLIPWHLLFALPVLAAAGGVSLLIPSVSLFFHETGHILAARAMGEELSELRIVPFGAALRLSGPPQSRSAELFIAAAGPAASLLFATVAAGLMQFFPQLNFLFGFCRYSLMLTALNLLPALPLDGGRILRALLRGIFPARPVDFILLLSGLSIAVGCFFLGLFKWPEIYPTALFFGVFLTLGAFSEWKKGPYNALYSAMRRESVFQKRRRMRLTAVALPAAMTVREALRRLDGASLIAVMDDSMHLLGTLAEGDLLRGITHGKTGICLSDLL